MDLQTARKLVELEQRLDGLVKPEVIRPWQDWTPTVTQGVGVAINIDYARYATVGNIVTIVVELAATAAGTAGQPIIISGVPVAIQPANLSASGVNVIGTVIIIDSGASWYHAALIAWGANDWRFIAHNVIDFVGAQPNFGLVNTDIISFQATYER